MLASNQTNKKLFFKKYQKGVSYLIHIKKNNWWYKKEQFDIK